MRKILFVIFILHTIGSFAQRQVIVKTIITNSQFFDDQFGVSFSLNISDAASFNYNNMNPDINPPGEMDDKVVLVQNQFTINSTLNLNGCPLDGEEWNAVVTPENFHNAASITTGACNVNGYVRPFYIEPFYLGPEPEMNSTFCKIEPIPLRSATGWQYRLINEGDTWYNFGSNPNEPNQQLLPDIVYNFSFEQISNNYDYTGPIQIRGIHLGVSTNIIQLEIIPCSPELLEPIGTIDTKCPETNDGGFVAQFDRALLLGEELQMTLYLIDDNDNEIPIVPTQTTSELDANNSFTWPVDLAAGTYFVKYQTVGGEYPASVVESEPFAIEPPDPVTFSLQHLNDVYCFGGSDGSIEIEAFGGTGNDYQYRVNGGNWQDFSNGNVHILSGLEPNEYEFEVRDGNECVGTSQDNTEIIVEPSEPVSITFDEYVEPTAYGFTDGSITVIVHGGTEVGYSYQWTDQNNNPINTTDAEYIQEGYSIKLHDITAGTYILTVTDANYNQAINKGGCIEIKDFELIGPPKLQLSIEETIPISCNSANNYNNPSNDGQLTAIASGGVPPYQYFWKKKSDNDEWQDIPNANMDVLSNLEAGEYAVNIEDANGIVVGTYVNNVLQQADDVVYVLQEPELLTVQIEKTDINCFGGTDGTATAIINGGTPPFEVLWSTGATTEMAEGLWVGNHTVYVMDALGCEAEGEITIGQPNEPVSIGNPEYVQPTANGFTDGSIVVWVNGGTPFNDNSYSFEWWDQQNNVINTVTAQNTPEGYAIQVHDIPAGTYTLTVTDANYENAIQKEGCTYVTDFELSEPPPLELSIEQTIPISCNGGNQFNNPSDDGQLMAIASGGVPFNPLIENQFAYIYTWKKKDDQSNWQIIPNVSGNLLDNVEAGEYAVNIEDANGIILGVYVNNVLEEPTDYLYPISETEPIVLQLDKMDVSCFNGNDGLASVAIEGGMPPYDISWSSGANTEIAENLLAGTHFVYVKDFYGCEASGQILIEQPNELVINIIDSVVPTCYDANNGSLSVEISGGMAPYTYLWNTGETVLSLSNLAEGIYILEVMDAIGCSAIKEMELKAPYPSTVDLGGDRTLCNGQEQYLDISVEDPAATYLWTSNNGFYSTSPQVNLSESGIYTATVTNSLGCSGSDTIEIYTTEIEIDSQFLITSQAFAGEEVVLVNTSSPIGTHEDWVFPEEAVIIKKSTGMAIVRFDEPGAFNVVLRNYQGACYQDVTKTIIVAEARELPDVGEAIIPFIKEFKVYPNPSSGAFMVVISLQEESQASLRLFGLTTNHVYNEEQLKDSAYYEIPYSLNLPSGVYLLLLETSKGSQIRKIVIL